MVPVLAVIIDVSVLAAREEDVLGERIRVGAHFEKRGVHVADCSGEVFQSVLKPACAHYVQSNMKNEVGQLRRPAWLAG
jgi:hypothetical protein